MCYIRIPTGVKDKFYGTAVTGKGGDDVYTVQGVEQYCRDGQVNENN